MKKTINLSLLLFPLSLFAQTTVNKSIPIDQGQKISMNFEYPDLIRVSTWDKNEISIHGEVNINNGENDDAFELLTVTSANTIVIESIIKDFKNLPQVVTIFEGGKKIMFKSKADYRKFKDENGSSNMISWGVDVDVMLEIKVPKNVETSITAVYGMVEVKDFLGPLEVVAKYGGVDVALNEKSVGELSAETNYGQIYSNLDVTFSSDKWGENDFHTFVTAKPGSGTNYEFKSQYGNVYLRKTN